MFKYEDQGVATLEDGLYVMEDKLKDPAFVDKMASFVKASMKGWAYARAHPEEAVKIVLDNDTTGAQTEHHQTQMMGEINKLTEGSDGRLDKADYERTVKTLLHRRLRPGHLQGADRRLYHRRHRQGARASKGPFVPPQTWQGLSFPTAAKRPIGNPIPARRRSLKADFRPDLQSAGNSTELCASYRAAASSCSVRSVRDPDVRPTPLTRSWMKRSFSTTAGAMTNG